MNLARPRVGLPLLAKELVEQAARRRTYVVRVVYAVLLFGAAFLIFFEILGARVGNAFAVLGRGREMFEALVALQFAGIYLFMPAITCGVLTQEKERSSLELLFLTRLGPWTILLEKYLSRVLPMFSFLLMSVPLLAFAYSLGGISQDDLWSGVWTLATTVLQVGAFALWCSAYFRTTVGAFVGSYVLGAAFYWVALIAVRLLHEFAIIDLVIIFEFFAWWFSSPGAPGPLFDHTSQFGYLVIGPALFFRFAPQVGLGGFVLLSLPMLGSTAAFLILARVFILRRAFVPARNPLLKLFRMLDSLFTRLNDRLLNGVVLVRESTTLPEDEPLAWRETAKRSLGTVRYLFRVFVALEAPTGFVILFMAIAGTGPQIEAASTLVFFLWIISALLISVASTSLIAGERSHQTLDVLLTTPLTGREILLQKMRGVRRLMLVLCVPFLTVFIFEAWWRGGFHIPYIQQGFEFNRAVYLTASLLSLAIYFPLIAWVSVLIGLRVRSQARAIFGSLAAIVAWCLLPVCFLIALLIAAGGSPDDQWLYLALLSPAAIIPFNQYHDYQEFGSRWAPVLLNFAIYGAVLYALRQKCLLNADRWLSRNPTS